MSGFWLMRSSFISYSRSRLVECGDGLVLCALADLQATAIGYDALEAAVAARSNIADGLLVVFAEFVEVAVCRQPSCCIKVSSRSNFTVRQWPNCPMRAGE